MRCLRSSGVVIRLQPSVFWHQSFVTRLRWWVIRPESAVVGFHIGLSRGWSRVFQPSTLRASSSWLTTAEHPSSATRCIAWARMLIKHGLCHAS